ncbi:MAG: hypothetical protein BM557_00580 [Flavobacterium sp. MedPE-SWcel]|uniref:hypothetical protein n=1 Tax=uncultured Flavobacterium sp. TaxID=165435 RepID=UPI00091BE404|nr:hypothetical protein [uncultured Flavobacterium sp.]OIQ22516.1 MAG: hypothetical protein BM557_00580 [Flavobacterium sp. MedPE-SWcel]
MVKRTYNFFLTIFLLVILIGCSTVKNNYKKSDNYLIFNPPRIERKDLYVGVKNNFTIIPKDKNLKLDFSVENGVFEKDIYSEYRYNLFTDNFNPTYLYIKYDNTIDTITFYKRDIPPPILMYKVRSIETLSIKEIGNSFIGFGATVNFRFNCIFEVLSMDILKISENKKSKSFENVMNKSPLMERVMKQAKVGEYYVFYNIKIKVKNTNDVIIRGENIVSKIVQ